MQEKIGKFIRAKPEYAEILTAAVKIEEDPPEDVGLRSGSGQNKLRVRAMLRPS